MYNDILNFLINNMKESLGKSLNVDKNSLEVNQNFWLYGVDSIILITLIENLNDKFKIALNTAAPFDYPNITELAEHICDKFGNQLEKRFLEFDLQMENARRIDGISASDTLLISEPNDQDIAIIGLSVKFPGADNATEFWNNLSQGVDSVIEVPKERWDIETYYDPNRNATGKTYSKWGGFLKNIDEFDPIFFNISPREADHLDFQTRLYLQNAWETLEDAGYAGNRFDRIRVGTFVGVMYGQSQLIDRDKDGNETASQSSIYASIANRVSFHLNFRGPSLAIDTMCSSSLTAIHLACKSLKDRECDMALAGGINFSTVPTKYIVLSRGRFLSGNGKCKSFGEGGDGYVPGEGIGSILLKPLNKAILDNDNIYAVIKSTSINASGKTGGYSVPKSTSQSELIKAALKQSEINPRTISYVEAHGTGTALGDPIEIEGLTNAFKEYSEDTQYCHIGSVKSNIGHLEAAAGIAGLAKVILQMKHKQLVPSIHSNKLNPFIDFSRTPFIVQQDLERWERPVFIEDGNEIRIPRRAAISAFGAGGANAHVILEESTHLPHNRKINSVEDQLVVLSALNEQALRRYASRLILYMDEYLFLDPNDQNHADTPTVSLDDIAYTLQIGRKELPERVAMVVSTPKAFYDKLVNFIEGDSNIDQFYKGNSTRKKKLYVQHIGNSDGNHIESNIKNRNLNELARLWVNGVDLNWELFYTNHTPNRISLPTYPFDCGKYWVKNENIAVAEDSSKNAKSANGLIAIKSADSKVMLRTSKSIPLPGNDNHSIQLNNKKQLKQTEIAQVSKKIYIEKAIIECLRIVLCIDSFEFEVDVPYEEYGVDSVMGAEIVEKLNEDLDIELEEIDLFLYSTISALAEHILAEFNPAIEGIDRNIGQGAQSSDHQTDPAANQHNNLYTPGIDDDSFPASSANRHYSPADIAIIGVSGKFPGAENLNDFWEYLSEGRNKITEIPKKRWDISLFYDPDNIEPDKTCCKWGGFIKDIDKFDASFFRISDKEAELSDPQHRLFLEESWKALEDAGYSNDAIGNKNCGVFVGANAGDYASILKEKNILPNSFSLSGNSLSMLATRLSHALNLKGPNLAIDTSCSSSLVAIHLACQSILAGESEVAIAGGVFINCTPSFYVLASRAGMLSKTGQCNTFDGGADGFVPGEGVGAVILKPLELAIKERNHIYGIIKGSGINQNGTTNGITTPSASAQTALQLEVYDKFRINPSDISYIEAHGTGTVYGDAIEIKALSNAFKKHSDLKQFCAIGSVKTNIGHTGHASGLSGLVKILLALKHHKIPASLNFKKQNSNINFQNSPFYVNTQLRDWENQGGKPILAAINSFGFSGTNCHMVIEEAPKFFAANNEDHKPYYLIMLSAKTDQALKQKIKDMLTWLEVEGACRRIKDIAYTLHIGRTQFNARCAFIVQDTAELMRVIRDIEQRDTTEGRFITRPEDNAAQTIDPKYVEYAKHIINELSENNDLKNIEYNEKLKALANIYVLGYRIDAQSLFKNELPHLISMPVYPFKGKSYWVSGARYQSYTSENQTDMEEVII